jgi:hypothetical protein
VLAEHPTVLAAVATAAGLALAAAAVAVVRGAFGTLIALASGLMCKASALDSEKDKCGGDETDRTV